MVSLSTDQESVTKPRREAFPESPKLQVGQLTWRLQKLLHHITAYALAVGTTQMLMQ